MIINFLDFVLPKTCAACTKILFKNENQICTLCRNDLPLMNSALITSKLITKLFEENAEIEKFTSLLNFEKETEVQELLHNLKYRGHQKLGILLGDWHASLLKKDSYFEDIDVVIPVPIHKNRFRKRGYNQVALYATTLATHFRADYNDRILVKSRYKKSQVFLNRKERFNNIVNSIKVNNLDELENKHVLLVDDIVTTGATIKACSRFLKQTNCKISVASIALAYGEGL